MSELGKKLRYKTNNGITGEITLYSTAAEAGDNYMNLLVDGVYAYAALGDVTDNNASNIRVTKGGKTFAVLKELAAFNFRGTYRNVPTNIWDQDDMSDYQYGGCTAFLKTDAGFFYLTSIPDIHTDPRAEDDSGTWCEGYTFRMTYPVNDINEEDPDNYFNGEYYTNKLEDVGCTHLNVTKTKAIDEDTGEEYWEYNCPLGPGHSCQSWSSRDGYQKCSYYDDSYPDEAKFWANAPQQITLNWGKGNIVLNLDKANKRYQSAYYKNTSIDIPTVVGDKTEEHYGETMHYYVVPQITISY